MTYEFWLDAGGLDIKRAEAPTYIDAIKYGVRLAAIAAPQLMRDPNVAAGDLDFSLRVETDLFKTQITFPLSLYLVPVDVEDMAWEMAETAAGNYIETLERSVLQRSEILRKLNKANRMSCIVCDGGQHHNDGCALRDTFDLDMERRAPVPA